jgi:tetratricopeptide (TPR) repeat protein
MGIYLRVLAKDYSGALEQFQAGLKEDPNNAALLTAAAGAERALGRWDQARAHLEQAQRIDPRSVAAARSLGFILHDTRHYREALAAEDHALTLSPNNLGLVQQKATTWISLGELDSARAVVHQALTTGADTTALIARFALFQEMMWTLDPALWPKLVKLRPENFNGDRGHWGLKVGGTWKLLGDTALAKVYADSALADFQARLEKFPENAQFQELVGRSLALGGHRAEAIAAAEKSLKMRETGLDASTGPYVRLQVARIMIQAGNYERALDLIEPLLSSPASDLTPAWLRLDPIFKPLRGNPRFEKLIAAK